MIAFMSLFFLIGSAGAFETGIISIGQAILQIIIGQAVFIISIRKLNKKEAKANE